jgi:YegS/Rv2252/BmrU family lipid kinase
MRRGLLLYNPAAGRLSVRPYLGRVLRILRAAGWKMEVDVTLNGRHAAQAARQAAAETFEAVFAVGGDGTMGQVASGLLGSQTALGVLPAGTTNVLAREMGMNSFEWHRWWALNENTRLLADAKPQSIDVGLCNGQPFLLWAGIGLDAVAIRRLEPRSRFFKYISVPHYFATTVWSAAFWNGMDLRVIADGQEVDGHFLLAVSTNIRHYAGGMAILSPNAYLDDGLMDLWLLSGASVADALRHFFDMLAGRHLTSDQARCITFRSAHIESDLPFSVQMDGEPMLGGVQAEIVSKPRALKLLMPSHALNLLQSPV